MAFIESEIQGSSGGVQIATGTIPASSSDQTFYCGFTPYKIYIYVADPTSTGTNCVYDSSMSGTKFIRSVSGSSGQATNGWVNLDASYTSYIIVGTFSSYGGGFIFRGSTSYSFKYVALGQLS